MNVYYSIDLKGKFCMDVCLNGKSTIKTAGQSKKK